jgi:hypothetical protein
MVSDLVASLSKRTEGILVSGIFGISAHKEKGDLEALPLEKWEDMFCKGGKIRWKGFPSLVPMCLHVGPEIVCVEREAKQRLLLWRHSLMLGLLGEARRPES